VIAHASRVVVHLSDLHFGREDLRVVSTLIDEIARLSPNLIAVSGDLTQRARRSQFSRARAFLDALPFPRLVVPGNHDVPLFNLIARLWDPLGGYRRAITSDLQPVFMDNMLVVVGMDTTKPSRLKAGRIPVSELNRLRAVLHGASPDSVKIFVGHHPFDLALRLALRAPRAKSRGGDEGGRSATSLDAPDGSPDDNALEALMRAGIDAFLTGHLHVSYTGHTAHRYNIGGRSAIVVEAGTATSTRLREDANAFNVLRIERETIAVERYEWHGSGFRVNDAQSFRRTDSGWAV
jgi:3',5'-cyclic AMP phosphodiesterase CpdA